MATQDDEQLGVVLGVLAGVILLVISLVFGIGLSRSGMGSAAGAGAGGSGGVLPALVTNASAASAAAGSDAASVRVDNGVVVFYFASGKADLAEGAAEALGEIVKGVASGRKAVVSGYHDPTGDAARNEELAKQRALAVQGALAALGVGEDKLELRKPEVTTASGTNAEARRVEVRLE